jgi:prolyl-tRNA synthetase
VRRDNGTKSFAKLESLVEKVRQEIDNMQSSLYKRSEDFIKANTHALNDYSRFKELLDKGGFIQAAWCGDTECELSIKAETGAKTTNMPFDAPVPTGKGCIKCGKPAKYTVNFARSY